MKKFSKNFKEPRLNNKNVGISGGKWEKYSRKFE